MKSGPTWKDCTVSARALNAAIRPAVRMVLPTLLAVPATTSLGVRTSSSILASLLFAQQGASSPKHLPAATVAQGLRPSKGTLREFTRLREPGQAAPPLGDRGDGGELDRHRPTAPTATHR